MRCITITYDYDGDDMVWVATCEAFINAVGNDPAAQGFSYQVAVADNGVTRIHWGRWDSEATLKHVQSQEYFATFAARVKEFADGAPNAVVATPRDHTSNW
ncbi:hypothetical protein [Shimia sagamensis]|uniref:Antibiotic biosynthesis monooxygenase n=1 Tax=Shimia sagamensis TaxID=1566352 RepID=A0ABY1NTG4_9RHOB|nr:hypothetical protein [Shimia sagamensis]SMP17711.1 hypothetical protein SAMN06265373_103189 [Shimia sagamensis]